MKCAVRIRPKAVTPKPGAADPLHDPEAAALYLVEVTLPAMRRELGGCCERLKGKANSSLVLASAAPTSRPINLHD